MVQDGAKMGQDGAKMSKDGAKMCKDGTKMAPRWAKMVPRLAKMAPRWRQDGAKMSQDGAKRAQPWKFNYNTALFNHFIGFCEAPEASRARVSRVSEWVWDNRKTKETIEKYCTAINFQGLRRSRPRKV